MLRRRERGDFDAAATTFAIASDKFIAQCRRRVVVIGLVRFGRRPAAGVVRGHRGFRVVCFNAAANRADADRLEGKEEGKDDGGGALHDRRHRSAKGGRIKRTAPFAAGFTCHCAGSEPVGLSGQLPL